MRWIALLLGALALLGGPVGAQAPACEDRLREREVLLRYYESSKARDLAEASRTIAEQHRVIERLVGELDALKKLPAGQNPGGPK